VIRRAVSDHARTAPAWFTVSNGVIGCHVDMLARTVIPGKPQATVLRRLPFAT
jgi:hypothetical protein